MLYLYYYFQWTIHQYLCTSELLIALNSWNTSIKTGKIYITQFRWSYYQTYYTVYIWVASHEKVPNVLSRCHTQSRMGYDCLSFFRKFFLWIFLDFLFFSFLFFFFLKSRCHTKKKSPPPKKTKTSVSYQKKDGRNHDGHDHNDSGH